MPTALLLSLQASAWALAWAPRSKTCAHLNTGASTPEALSVAGAGGAARADTRIWWLKHAPAPPSSTIKYLRRTASGAAGNGLGTMAKYLRCTRNGAAGNGLGTRMKYL
jgi:hypothetical protein